MNGLIVVPVVLAIAVFVAIAFVEFWLK